VGISIGIGTLSYQQSVIFCLLSITALTIAFTLYKTNKIIPFISILLLFCSIGSLLLNENKITGNKENFKKNYKIGDSYIIDIVEVGNKTRKWKKIISTVTHLKKNNKIIDCNEDVVLFIETNKDTLQIGDKLTLNTDLNTIKNKGNPGEFDSEYFWKSKGISKIGFVSNQSYIKLGNSISWFNKWSTKSRDYLGGILSNHFKDQELAVAQALILGDRSFLDSETTQAFGNSGAMHVLAVSGLHIGIILQLILYILKGFSKIITRKKSLLIALIIIWIYTIISGLSASVLRATFMFSVLAISQIYEKNYNPINGLFFTGFVLLLINPLFLFDIGFQLSFLAMIGIFWFYKPISKIWFVKNKWLRKVWEGTAVGLLAQLVTVPLTFYYFHQFPNYFILTNIGLMLSTGLILGLGMLIFSFYWLKYIGKIAVYILNIVLIFTLGFVQFIDKLPGSVASGFVLNWKVVLISYALIISFYLFKKRRDIQLFLYVLSFFLISFIVYQRFSHLNYSEICFYNNSKLTVSIKNKEDLFCFYNGEAKDLSKIKFIIESYIKLYPSKVHYLSIRKKDWKIQSNHLSIKISKKKNGTSIQLNGKNYFVKQYENSEDKMMEEKVICMPWVTPHFKNEYSLEKGAIRYRF